MQARSYGHGEYSNFVDYPIKNTNEGITAPEAQKGLRIKRFWIDLYADESMATEISIFQWATMTANSTASSCKEGKMGQD